MKREKERFAGTEMERVRGESTKRLAAERLSRKKAKIKDQGKFGYAFANHELAATASACVCNMCAWAL